MIKKIRVWLFTKIFSESEQTSIINALWRRVDDKTTDSRSGQLLRYECKKLAMELGQ